MLLDLILLDTTVSSDTNYVDLATLFGVIIVLFLLVWGRK